MIAKADTWDKGLTDGERAFIPFRCDPGSETYNNVKRSYMKAYPKSNETSAESSGIRLTRKDKIIKADKLYRAELTEIMDITREEVISNAKYLVNMGIRDNNGTDIGKGNEQLAKIAGVFSEKRVIEDVGGDISPEEREIYEKLAREANIKLSGTGS